MTSNKFNINEEIYFFRPDFLAIYHQRVTSITSSVSQIFYNFETSDNKNVPERICFRTLDECFTKLPEIIRDNILQMMNNQKNLKFRSNESYDKYYKFSLYVTELEKFLEEKKMDYNQINSEMLGNYIDKISKQSRWMCKVSRFFDTILKYEDISEDSVEKIKEFLKEYEN